MRPAERRDQGFGLTVLLMSLAALVLLVCCANIANLLLAQAEGRRREMATRAALGASRFRIARQMLAETLLLSAISGTLGLLLASWLTELIPAALPLTSLPLNLDFGVDARVSAFVCLIAIVATVAIGSVPVLHAVKVDLMSALRGQRTMGGERNPRLSVRNVLVVGQVAACFALLTASGLLIHSLVETTRIHPGFERQSMLLLETNPGLAGYSRAESLRSWTN